MVPLSKFEAKLIKKLFGEDKVIKIKEKYFLAKRQDDSCIFLRNNTCSIQEYKPLACKLWPFYIYRKPLRDHDKRSSAYDYRGEIFYVYVDPSCRGLNKGFTPITDIVKEAIKLYIGEQRKQVLTTYRVPSVQKIKRSLIYQISEDLIVKRINFTQ